VRLSLSRKILIVFSFLISFTLVQGLLVHYSLHRLHTLENDLNHIRDFQGIIHKIESTHLLDPSSPFLINTKNFDREYNHAKKILAQINSSRRDSFTGPEYDNLLKADQYLDNYRVSYLKVVALYQKNYILHQDAISMYYGIEKDIEVLPREVVVPLFPLLLELYSLVEEVLDDSDVSLIPKLKQVAMRIELLTPQHDILFPVRALIGTAEQSYLNSLAIQEHHSFLADTTAHFVTFTNEILVTQKDNIERLEKLMLRFIITTVAAALLFSFALFVGIRRYFKNFLQSQQTAITAIEAGTYDYPLPPQPDDELGDLASFMKGMAGKLQISAEEIRRSQQKLRISEELYRSLIENIDMGVTLIDRDHTVIMTNSAQGRMFNRDSATFRGQKCFREFEKREQICDHCPGVTAMETGKAQEQIAQGVRDDGSSLTVRIKAFPVYKNNTVSGFIEVVEDITQQQGAEKALAEEKERLAVTLRSIGDAVISTDTAGRINLMNKVAEELTGWMAADASGRLLREILVLINQNTGKPLTDPVESVLKSGSIATLVEDTVLIARDGREISIAASGAPIRDKNSEIIGVVLVFRDVTEQNRMEEELLKTKKLESIGILAGGIAHDFNNILSAILGNINLVRHIIRPDELKAQTFLEQAEKASIRAQNLTQQLLTFSKGGEPLRQKASILQIIGDSTEFILRGTSIKYEYDIPTDTWAVDVDPGQISQVVQNIVLNARHAMPAGGTIQISCRNVAPDHAKPASLDKNMKYVMVAIADNGTGIPKNVINNIFDPYFSTKKDGSGLGLSICHSIITKHHGHIAVSSEEGSGTVFTFYVPATDSPFTEEEAIHEEKVYAEHAITVLLMDDDEQVRTIGEAMLAHLGCNTLLAQDGEEALEVYKTFRDAGQTVDVVIMDLTIPGGMGGREAVAELLNIDPEAKVIVSSGYSHDPVMANFTDYGFCAAIVKPYLLKELAKIINDTVAV